MSLRAVALLLTAWLAAVGLPAAVLAQTQDAAQPPAQDAAQPLAQDASTLADLQNQLHLLTEDLQSLRTELVASGAAGFQAAGGDNAIDRMNAMEQQLTRLTGQTEQLQNRIQRIVRDGTRRIGDIEFRLCEMDPGCDLGALMSVPELGSQGAGGGSGLSTGPVIGTNGSAAGTAGTAQQPSATEQQDFDRAQEVLGQGDFLHAAQLFAAVAETHAGGPLTSEALFLRGSALDSAGDADQAAAAWLESFAADPQGQRAGESLLGIARIIADKGDPVAACLYLSEIPVRFAGSDPATEAQRRMDALNCGAGELPDSHADAAIGDEATADMAEHE
ncbi:tol-pal system protein [Paracoccus sp. M683]|uniref:tetratricopeptide repeat protein n=1 Tax=Paracoccus sp. M683 TaxID=2594268 RepID=UPI00117FFBCD|nr:tetratricopeptide repeat protein [Paracoccus sp. M683]TRW97519.1 tol-pal system protein [Paracoccus sp. M683]